MKEVDGNQYLQHYDMAKDFAGFIQYCKETKGKEATEKLLKWTIGTLYKGYDRDEDFEHLHSDTIDFLEGEANYMFKQ